MGDVMEIILLSALIVTQFAVIGYLGYIFLQERGRNSAKETELLHLLICKNMPEYAQTTGMLRNTPENKIKAMQVENELAINAAKFEREERKKHGIPVT